MFFLLCILPITIGKAVFGMYGIAARHEASWLRTIGDAGCFFTLSALIFTTLSSLRPALANFKSCTTEMGGSAACMEQAQALLLPQALLPALNGLLLLWEVLRYAGNQDPAAGRKAPGKAD